MVTIHLSLSTQVAIGTFSWNPRYMNDLNCELFVAMLQLLKFSLDFCYFCLCGDFCYARLLLSPPYDPSTDRPVDPTVAHSVDPLTCRHVDPLSDHPFAL